LWLPLESVEHGDIRVRFRWHAAVDNASDDDVSVAASYIVSVYIDRCTNLVIFYRVTSVPWHYFCFICVNFIINKVPRYNVIIFYLISASRVKIA
jgi:hypothetical protein